jgi:site-specific DNA-methyltransferase (adenine-specific)
MCDISIILADVEKFLKDFDDDLFHAVLTDPPYNLDSISKRFGKVNSKPSGFGKDGAFNRVSKGFMGKEWDTDIAFRKEFWELVKSVMYPGAFGLSFMGSRTYHKAASALEDAGFIIHPLIGWVQSQGFPKPTRIDTQIDRAAGAERRVVGKIKNPGSTNPRVAMHDGWQIDPDITEPSTEMARVWEGYRYGLQALKPAMEPIIMFQKPYEGKPYKSIVETGAGALNIAGTKFPVGREFFVNRFTDGMKPFGHGAGHSYEQSVENMLYPANFIIDENTGEPYNNFFYQAKANVKERNFGLDTKNTHPTIKPIGLTEYLAKLLIPPDTYTPRRVFVPFSGTGSEVIGCMLAGWEFILGVELEQESYDMSLKRIGYWKNEK